MGKWVIPAWVPVLVTAVAVFAVASADNVERDYDETFEGLSRDTRLVLRHGDGEVILSPWERDAVEVRVRYRKSVTRIGFGGHPDLDVEFRRYGDTLEVIGRERPGFTVGVVHVSREHEFVYRIQAPPWLRLELWGDDGDVRIDGWTGVIEARTDDGDFLLHDIDSPRIELTLDDGNLDIERFRGGLTARLGDGDLRLVDGESDLAILRLEEGKAALRRCGGRFEIRSDEGDLKIEDHVADRLEIRGEESNVDLSLRPGAVHDVDVAIGEGNVLARLPADLSARLDLGTADGDVAVRNAAVRDLRLGDRQATGRLGEGTGTIRLRSREGDVRLLDSEG